MTEWYEHMVMGEKASRHRFDILERIRRKKGLRGIYVIVPASNPGNILDIIPAAGMSATEVMQYAKDTGFALYYDMLCLGFNDNERQHLLKSIRGY